jgi:hypothetical protein
MSQVFEFRRDHRPQRLVKHYFKCEQSGFHGIPGALIASRASEVVCSPSGNPRRFLSRRAVQRLCLHSSTALFQGLSIRVRNARAAKSL